MRRPLFVLKTAESCRGKQHADFLEGEEVRSQRPMGESQFSGQVSKIEPHCMYVCPEKTVRRTLKLRAQGQGGRTN